MQMRSGTRRAAIGLGFWAACLVMMAGHVLAGAQDSVFFISPDGSNVAFDVRDVPRREVLSRLLRSESIEFEWGDSALAEERITGAFKGSVEAVLQRLLAQADYVVIYSSEGGQRRIARLIIVNKGGAPSQSIEPPKPPVPGLVAGAEAPRIAPGTPADLMPLQPAQGMVPPLVPAPAGMPPGMMLTPPASATQPLWVSPPAAGR